MRLDAKQRRQQEIAEAAYAVLEKKGYEGASMLAVAKAARASNETLYNWYGDKQGLFRALVTANAAMVKDLLEQRTAAHDDPMDTLRALGPKLLELLTGARAVALNRAAAADPSGELGMAISQAGRETIAPLIGKVLDAARGDGRLAFASTAEAVDLYLGLLVGDLQIRCVVGREAAPSAPACRKRADTALEYLCRLMGKTR